MRKIFLYILATILIIGCSSTPRFTSEKQSYPTAKPTVRFSKDTSQTVASQEELSLKDPANSKVFATEIGVASYYAEPFHGRRTANGEIYNMYELTAAHPSFPLGTIAKVTNLKNGKTAIIKINDRMPKRPDRIIDLSYGTAIILGMVKDGITKVKIEVLKWGDNKYHKEN